MQVSLNTIKSKIDKDKTINMILFYLRSKCIIENHLLSISNSLLIFWKTKSIHGLFKPNLTT